MIWDVLRTRKRPIALKAASLCVAIIILSAATESGRPQSQTDQLYPHSEGLHEPWGYIDRAGRMVIPPQFDRADDFHEGLARVQRNKKFGYIDYTGNVVIEERFDQATEFASGRAAVKIDNSWTVIERSGNQILPPQFSSIHPFREDRAVVTLKGKRGAIDPSGHMVIQPQFELMSDFSEGLAVVVMGKKRGFVRPDGSIAIPLEFDFATSFRNGRARVSSGSGPNAGAGLIDTTGRLVVRYQNRPLADFREGLAPFGDGDIGFMDMSGSVVIPPKYRGIVEGGISEGLIAVATRDGHRWGYIDFTGEFKIEPRFGNVRPFQGGLAVVGLPSIEAFGPFDDPSVTAPGVHYGVIDRSGKFIAKPIFDSIEIHSDGLIQVTFARRRGYLNGDGHPITFASEELDAHVRKTRQRLVELSKLNSPEGRRRALQDAHPEIMKEVEKVGPDLRARNLKYIEELWKRGLLAQ
jgi:hypothetical protein